MDKECLGHGQLFYATSDVLAWLWPEAMALAWLSLALASLFPGQGQTPWLWLGLGLAWLRPWLRVKTLLAPEKAKISNKIKYITFFLPKFIINSNVYPLFSAGTGNFFMN